VAEHLSLPRVVIVTGTGTGIGKTVTTAALTVMLLRRGVEVAVVKPTQTGVGPDEPGDIAEVRRLAGGGATYHELVRLPDPLAPASAARRAGVSLPSVAAHARRIEDLTGSHDVVLVEGAGGLLVRLDTRGGTLADLGSALRYKGVGAGFIIVVEPGLGSLNHTALTAEALRRRDLPILGLVIGSWPADPDLAMTENRADLPAVAGSRLLGTLPWGAGGLPPQDFQQAAPQWLTVE